MPLVDVLTARPVRAAALLVMVLALAACRSAPGPGASPAPPGPEPPPAPTGAAPPTLLFDGLHLDAVPFSSARTSLQFAGSEADGEPASLLMEGWLSVQQSPPASRIENSFSARNLPGFGQGGTTEGRFVLTTLDGQATFEVEGAGGWTCLAFPAGEIPPGVLTLSVVDFLPGDEPLELALVDDAAQASGQPAYHYRREGIRAGQLQDAALDVWAAASDGRLLRIELADAGEFVGLGPGTLVLVYEPTGGDPIPLALPEDCPAP